jgi:hypothetical protein
MNLKAAVPPDELLLAQLAASKLSKIVHGLMSVGLASLELEPPGNFLAGRDKVLLGFVEVLRCIAVKPGHGEELELLRHSVERISVLAQQFHAQFPELAGWRALPSDRVREGAHRLLASYTALCESLGALCLLLGADFTESNHVQRAREAIETFLHVPAR